jgi:hypothetical protein
MFWPPMAAFTKMPPSQFVHRLIPEGIKRKGKREGKGQALYGFIK